MERVWCVAILPSAPVFPLRARCTFFYSTARGLQVRTAAVQRDEHMLKPWMERMEPIILVGPEGCGKHMLLSTLFSAQRSTQARSCSGAFGSLARLFG